MTMLFQFGISNAIVATLLAAVVTLLTMRSKSPAWVHALWVLVLVKLVTPPFLWFDAASLSDPTATFTSSTVMVDSFIQDPSSVDTPMIQSSVISTAENKNDLAKSSSTWDGKALPWMVILGSVWILGSVGFLLRFARQIYKTRCWIKSGSSATRSVLSSVNQTADRLGLSRVPSVVMVGQIVTPSVFAVGRHATLVLPVGLLDEMDDREIETVIVHELIHLRRGDGWIRLLEMVSSVLFWWHPIVPFVRRGIHQAGEEVCDAWVTSTLSGSCKSYASAMLKTVDFLASENAPRPALITGMGDVASLAKRMRRISEAATVPVMSWPRRGVMTVIAIALLPLGCLTLPQSQAQQPTPPVKAKASSQADQLDASSDPFGDSGQSNDPFGGGGSADPFASPPKSDSTPAKKKNIDPKTVDSKNVEQWLRGQLSKSVTAIPNNTPLNEFVRQLSRQIQAPIVVDHRGLEEIGLKGDVSVKISLTGVSARSLLRIVLRDLDLAYMIKDDVIQITSREVAENTPTMTAYGLPPAMKDKSEKVIVALKATVHSDKWDTAGGPSTATAIDNVLVITTTEDVHDTVGKFLKKVEAEFNRRNQ